MRVYQLISTANSKEQIKLPVNPSQFELDDPQLNQKITLLNVGEANQLGGVGLITGSLSSSLLPLHHFINELIDLLLNI